MLDAVTLAGNASEVNQEIEELKELAGRAKSVEEAASEANPRACSHSKTYEVPRSQDNSRTAPLGYYNEYAALHFASNIKVEL